MDPIERRLGGDLLIREAEGLASVRLQE